jgi:hypothetical protein
VKEGSPRTCGVNAAFAGIDGGGDGPDNLLCTSADPQVGTVYGLYAGYLLTDQVTRGAAFCIAMRESL